jgi:hypothetical protein
MIVIRTLVALVLALSIAGCNGNSPTEPGSRHLDVGTIRGTWSGSLAVYPPGEDWSSVTLILDASGSTVTGRLVPRNGVEHEISGEVEPGRAYLRINVHSTTPAPCDTVHLSVDGLETRGVAADALVGSLVGRCPNTLLGRFRLEKR